MGLSLSTRSSGAIAACPSEVTPSLDPLDFGRCLDDDRILGVIAFPADQSPALPSGLPPVAMIDMPSLADTNGMMEVWRGILPARHGEFSGIRYAENGEFMFGVMDLDDDAIEASAFMAYQNLITMARHLAYPHILRVWNHFSGINDEQAGMERYQRFCMGRYRAYEAAGYTARGGFPAASALGARGNRLWIYFIAARHSGSPIENPRQVSAYHYPPVYGPSSPSFSRAMKQGHQLFVSGTASIVGHATAHESEAVAQCLETLTNLRTLLTEANPTGIFPPPSSSWRVYLRSASDHPAVRDCLTSTLGQEARILFLEGDICRADLLVEIEAVVRCTT